MAEVGVFHFPRSYDMCLVVENVDLVSHLQQLFDSARSFLSPAAFAQLKSTWLTGDPPQFQHNEP